MKHKLSKHCFCAPRIISFKENGIEINAPQKEIDYYMRLEIEDSDNRFEILQQGYALWMGWA